LQATPHIPKGNVITYRFNKGTITMTRKDYKLLGEAIKPYAETLYRNGHRDMEVTVENVVIRIAKALAGDNPRFDRSKFMSACGFPGYGEAE
jgi:hypothetical protein